MQALWTRNAAKSSARHMFTGVFPYWITIGPKVIADGGSLAQAERVRRWPAQPTAQSGPFRGLEIAGPQQQPVPGPLFGCEYQKPIAAQSQTVRLNCRALYTAIAG